MSKTLSMMIAAVVLASSSVFAGPYVSAGIGGARTESSLAELGLVPNLTTDTDVIGTDPDFSSTDVSFDVTAGWMFGKFFGVEVGYMDFGRATQNYTLPEACDDLGCQSREWTAQMDLEALRAYIIGNLPLNEQFDVYAKIGVVQWDADYAGFERNQAFVPGPPIAERNDPVSFDDDGTDVAAGLGLVLKTESAFSLRADFTWYNVDTTDLLWTAQLMAVYSFD